MKVLSFSTSDSSLDKCTLFNIFWEKTEKEEKTKRILSVRSTKCSQSIEKKTGLEMIITFYTISPVCVLK